MAAVAPMDLVVAAEPASIPLRCTLCPKKPNFSDLSHLLTHISSKSHLAHRFKAELKARDDRAALEAVRQYDLWCDRYGINGLLAERMAAKEQRKTGRRVRNSNAANNKPALAAASEQNLVKPDPEEFVAHSPAHWSTARGTVQEGHHERFDSSNYPTSSLKRSRSDRSVPWTPENETRSRYRRRWPSEADTTDSAPASDFLSESTEFCDENDTSKLKGVKYPGMGLFDSADEAQKRMRNQRKDDSVLKQMEETSSGIVPNEFVWGEDGQFQRIRDIYASPSIEGSPDRKFEDRDAPKPKRGRRSTTAASATATSGPARRRSSARLARQAPSRNKHAQQGDNSELSVSVDSYDVFRDPPKLSPARTESSPGGSGFDLRRRPALQSLNSNMPLTSAGQKPHKLVPYVAARENGSPLFTSQPPVPTSSYFQHHHVMGAGTFNPLYVQGRGSFYNPYGYSNFGADAKSSATNFQVINSMNLASMPFNAFGGPFASDSAHERVDQDFDL
ncbi:hypothetical protein MYCTH_43484 [Thermothelomyces thermophilus ATCC 42464]|uniref:Uncharacterized protein n=1 Tax=Thermothelomyces thermophilus (strain ATCC 42464 / BCRC 31852 / DSM 1799) TaxID=573729 RepID=G2Q6A9_THET4|nr:uncharacterized protein MYCTH_43484 [Thermothelomyces thermophilus ATCC 42464]AEO53879.1 hypothetical protein MYCTH_43484 [Thermothelomyces thermophilus ATCC 42464]